MINNVFSLLSSLSPITINAAAAAEAAVRADNGLFAGGEKKCPAFNSDCYRKTVFKRPAEGRGERKNKKPTTEKKENAAAAVRSRAPPAPWSPAFRADTPEADCYRAATREGI